MPSLLETVTQSLGYENLGGGYKQPTSRITSVPSREANGVRQALGLPNGPVPGAQNPIPTSTARPGKQTNQRIVYTRVQNQFDQGCSNIARISVMEGDVVFVFRQDGTNTPGINSGHDVGRTSRIASMAQLNQIFDRGNVHTTGELTMGGSQNPRGLTEDEWVNEERTQYADRAAAKAAFNSNPVWHRWKHARTLARWTPDGVLASKEHDCVSDVTNPGEAFNVTVGGPTLTRNSAHGEFPQHFGDGVRLLDKLFIGLIASEHRVVDASGEYGKVVYFSYTYKLFTSRQLIWAPFSEHVLWRKAPHGQDGIGPSIDEYARMVQVWRVGSVLDSKAGMMPYKCATVNVVIEPWNLSMVEMEYNPYFGESLALAPLAQEMTVIELLTTAKKFMSESTPSINLAWGTLSELYKPTFANEVAQWEAQWEAVKAVNAERDPTKTSYADASQQIKEFYSKFVSNGAYGCVDCRVLFLRVDVATDDNGLNVVGRAVALNSQKALMAWVDSQGTEYGSIIRKALELHVIIMKMRPIFRMGESLSLGKQNLGWPLR